MKTLRTNPLVILCDFDGTITHQDTTDTLLGHFGMSGYEEFEEAWKAGKIGSRICMREQIALLNMSPAELDACLEQIEIDSTFKLFAATAASFGIPLYIVSDGLDYVIHQILQRNGIADIPVYANHLSFQGERGWQLDFPYASPDCEKDSGHCKCRHVSAPCTLAPQILYIGDGTSDFCVSNRVSHVFAKNKLISYCLEYGISHTPIRHFDDAQSLWPFICREMLPTMSRTII